MDNLSKKEEIFLNLYTKHKHNETANSIKKTHGHLINSDMNFESVLELGSNYMYLFGKTNGQEMFDFIQNHKVTFSDNKFKSIYSTLFNRDIEVDIDFAKIKENVFDNYKLVTEQAANFLKEVGCNEKQVNLFTNNCTKFVELAQTLVHDYFYHTRQPLDPALLENKHLHTILKEMGDGYDNMRVVFRDADKKDQWSYDHGLLILPSKAMLIHHNTSVDLINNLGGGYEISTIVKDKAFFDNIRTEHMSYEPDNRLYQSMKKEIDNSPVETSRLRVKSIQIP
ncbi:hypothetical protein [Pseudomonas sp. NBRC 111118]|uniref:hypothetical protein n=3 Tax=unclassified Pseudomonas TaxID=196821 RepID=UPI0006D47CCE|nr:hypothetical protein [Pseudomonas sp. NBRC 111118]